MTLLYRMEPITAKVPDIEALWRSIVNRMNESGQDIAKSYGEFTDTWEEKPQYSVTFNKMRNVGTIEGLVRPVADDGLLQIMAWTIYGTKGHPITPKGEGYPLRFPSVFTPKTQPGVIQSVAGGKDWNSPITTTYYVDHPGTTPRGTIAQILQLHRPRFILRMDTAVREGIKAARARAK